MIRRPPRSTPLYSSAASDVYKRQVSNHPSIKMLALTFLVVVGVVLMAEGLGHHIPKGYIYFAMAFSLGVEMLNIRFRKRAKTVVQLHQQQP